MTRSVEGGGLRNRREGRENVQADGSTPKRRVVYIGEANGRGHRFDHGLSAFPWVSWFPAMVSHLGFI